LGVFGWFICLAGPEVLRGSAPVLLIFAYYSQQNVTCDTSSPQYFIVFVMWLNSLLFFTAHIFRKGKF
jgi:hypothetical protein